MSLRYAITGIDATGKTTLVAGLRESAQAQSGRLIAYHCPHYHLNPGVPFADLSRAILEVNLLANRTGDAALKATGLFLGMTLFGRIEQYFLAQNPRLLVSERHAIVDSFAYAAIYQPILKKNAGLGPMRTLLETELSLETRRLLQDWVSEVAVRAGVSNETLNLAKVPQFLLGIFEASPRELLPLLGKIYECQLPDVVLLLEAPAAVIQQRLELRRLQAGSLEVHENPAYIPILLKAFRDSCERLRSTGMRLHIMDTGEVLPSHSIESSLRLTEVSL